MEENVLFEAVNRIRKTASTKQAKICASFTPGDLVEITQKGASKLATVVKTANKGTVQAPNWTIQYKDQTGKLAEWKQADGGTIKQAGLWKNLIVTLGVLGGMVGIGVAGHQYDERQAQQAIQQINQKLDLKVKGLVDSYKNAPTPEAKQKIKNQAVSDQKQLEQSRQEVNKSWQANRGTDHGSVDSLINSRVAADMTNALGERIKELDHALSQMK